jgi:hypothetical protein
MNEQQKSFKKTSWIKYDHLGVRLISPSDFHDPTKKRPSGSLKKFIKSRPLVEPSWFMFNPA